MPTFFIDSAERVKVTELLSTGLFGGVTTNPAILDKAGLGSSDIPDFVKWATDAGARLVFTQSWGNSVAELVDRGHALRALGGNVVVKVPASRDGVEAAAILARGGKVLVTATYSAFQVLPAIASGATYIAPFVDRMITNGRDGIGEVLGMQTVLDTSQTSLEILAGSLRTPDQVLALAQGGVQNMTFGPDVWDLFFADDLTAASVAQFETLASL